MSHDLYLEALFWGLDNNFDLLFQMFNKIHFENNTRVNPLN